MAHPLLKGLSRRDRINALAKERTARATGQWGDWTGEQIPFGMKGSYPGTWQNNMRWALHNRAFLVLSREVKVGQLDHMTVIHLAVDTLSKIRPTWDELQKIKNQLGGGKRVGVEIFPKQRNIDRDDADMTHIWLLPETTYLGFGLNDEENPHIDIQRSVFGDLAPDGSFRGAW
jgi:hypothetical protein